MPRYTAIVTLMAVLLYFFVATRVAVARQKFNVPLPASGGHPDFDRVFRVHMNMLEWMPIFLPLLWLCALYYSDVVAAVLGLVWIVGRSMYYAGYAQAVEKRVPWFVIHASACVLLLLGAILGIVTR